MEEYSLKNYVGRNVCVVFECGCRCLSITGKLCWITDEYFIIKDCCHRVYHIRKDKIVYFTCSNPCCCC